MEKVVVDTKNWIVIPDIILIRHRNTQIEWRIDTNEWEFAAKVEEAFKIGKGHSGTDPVREFDEHDVQLVAGNRRVFKLRSRNLGRDVYKYTLTLQKKDDPKEIKVIDPMICNTGDF
ncbi:MAG: hypothetical protein AB7E79_07095 [Rhodospirillaceae bacterium]